MADKNYQIAAKLQEIVEFHDLEEDELDALESAISIISPAFVQDMAAELEAGMNSPEAKAFAEEVMKTDRAKQIIEEHGGTVNGKILRFGEKNHD